MQFRGNKLLHGRAELWAPENMRKAKKPGYTVPSSAQLKLATV